MKSRLRFALLIPLATLLGCTLPSTPSTTGTAPTGNWDNWQIQTGTSTTTPPTALTSPPTGFYLVGAMQTQGSQVTAIFQDGGSGPVNFTGSFDATTSILALGSIPPYLAAQLTLPSNPNTLATGNVSVGCAPPPPGGATCTAIALLPAAGAEIASVTGTFAGALTASTEGDGGQATLTVTQSTTPNADGSFSLGGTFTFPAGSGLGTYPVSGIISGEGITIYDPTPGIVPVVSLTATTNPTGTQISVSNLAFALTASDIVTFTGTLTRQ